MLFKLFAIATFTFYTVLLVVLVGNRFLPKGRKRGAHSRKSDALFKQHGASRDGAFLSIINLSKAFDYPVLESVNLSIVEFPPRRSGSGWISDIFGWNLEDSRLWYT